MPRFVILLHETPPSYVRPTHWDLMLEDGDHLLTWALADMPQMDCDTDAEQLSDHRIEYLSIEGPLSRDCGTVQRVAEGEFEWLVREKNEIVIALGGEALQGTVQLIHRGGQSWRLLLRDALP